MVAPKYIYGTFLPFFVRTLPTLKVALKQSGIVQPLGQLFLLRVLLETVNMFSINLLDIVRSHSRSKISQ